MFNIKKNNKNIKDKNLIINSSKISKHKLSQSFIPLFILNKLSKIPNWAKFMILYISIKLSINYINSNYPGFFENINYNYVLFGYILFLMFVLYVVLKLIIIIYLLKHKDNLIQLKPYKYLDKSFKDFITIVRNSNSDSLNIIVSQNLFLLKVNSLLLIIGISSLIYLKFLLI